MIFQISVPEILFQPSLRGVEQAGLQDTIAFVLKHYPDNIQNLLTQVKEHINYKYDF